MDKWIILSVYVVGILLCFWAIRKRFAGWLCILLTGMIAGLSYHLIVETLLLQPDWNKKLLSIAPGRFWALTGAWSYFLSTILQAIGILWYLLRRICGRDARSFR